MSETANLVIPKIPFNKTTFCGSDVSFDSGFPYHNKRYLSLTKEHLKKAYPNAQEVFLTKSCTNALELAVLVADISDGDEVILPSFGFVGTANAVALRKGKCIFIDIRKDTLNIDETKIEQALSSKTKAVISINYGGVACNYEYIQQLKKKHGFILIEDNAQGVGSFYRDQPLGSFGDMSALSFDALKNISCGEGGCLILNNDSFYDKLRVAYELGTNRQDFFKKKTEKYEWKGLGSNYALSEYLAQILYHQLLESNEIVTRFIKIWNLYYQALKPLEQENLITLPIIPEECQHNGHIFHIRTRDLVDRDKLMKYLNENEVQAQFHFTPLHLSEFGSNNFEFRGDDYNTLNESSRLLRLPMFFTLTEVEQQYVVKLIYEYFGLKP